MARQIFFMRHGETLFNKQDRMQGACDSPLTEKGIADAHAMGKKLAEMGVSFDAFFCSTSERACDTLEIVMEELGATEQRYERMKGLKEFYRGRLEGQPRYLIDFRHNRETMQKVIEALGGEPEEETTRRITAALVDIANRPGVERALVVSHGGCGGLFSRTAKNIDSDLPRPMPNCGIYVYEYEPSDEGSGEFSFIEPIFVQL